MAQIFWNHEQFKSCVSWTPWSWGLPSAVPLWPFLCSQKYMDGCQNICASSNMVLHSDTWSLVGFESRTSGLELQQFSRREQNRNKPVSPTLFLQTRHLLCFFSKGASASELLRDSSMALTISWRKFNVKRYLLWIGSWTF